MEENKRIPFELNPPKSISFRINNNFNPSPLHLNCNIHWGNFQAFISRRPRPGFNNNEVTFLSVRTSLIELEKMHDIEFIYISITALENLKMSIDFYFDIVPEKKEEKKSSTPLEKEVLIEFKEDKVHSCQNNKKRDIIKKNKFFNKKIQSLRFQYQTEFHDFKTNYNHQISNIKQLYGKIIKNLKKETKTFEVTSNFNYLFLEFNFVVEK